MKIPVSCADHNTGKSISRFFYEILTFHIPPSKDAKILDPTCGQRLLWKFFLRKTLSGCRRLDQYGEVVFSDITDFGFNIVSDVKELAYKHEFNGIVFDPPYLFGYKGDVRKGKKQFGDYGQMHEQLIDFMDVANIKFPDILKEKGKVIVKCSDQFYLKEKKFYPLHITWVERMTSFELVDIFIYIYYGISPTAYQVKDRPCSIVKHTYFLVFKVK